MMLSRPGVMYVTTALQPGTGEGPEVCASCPQYEPRGELFCRSCARSCCETLTLRPLFPVTNGKTKTLSP